MNCPKCRSKKYRYVISRKKHWKRKASHNDEPRTDFNAECSKCGFKGVVKEVD